jgi:predicted RND superfamily exporter protein
LRSARADPSAIGAREHPESSIAVSNVLIRARVVTLVAAVILLGFLIWSGKRVGYEQSIKSFFADDDPAMALYRRASAGFGDDNFVFLAYDDPNLFTAEGMDRLQRLAAAVAPGKIDGVERVESLDAMPLLWKVDDTLIAIDRLPTAARNFAVRTIKDNIGKLSGAANPLTVAAAVRQGDTASRAELRARIVKHPLFKGTLIDSTGTTTAVVARLKKTDRHFVQSTITQLRHEADTFAAENNLTRPAVVGPPVLLADGFAAIELDGRRLAVVGMLLIGLVTLMATRSIWWALIPILAGWIVWLGTEWLLATFNMRLSLSGGPLVAQIIVLTMPAASHLAIHYREARRRQSDARLAAVSTLRDVSSPIVWTAITGAIGYGALVTSSVAPIQQFGYIMGICTLVASLLTMFLAPTAMLPPFRLELPVKLGSEAPLFDRMTRLTAWVERHPGAILIGVIGLVVPLGLGMTRLTYESNYINAFMPTSRVVRDYQAVETKLGGIGVVQLVVPFGHEATPASLEKFRKLESTLIDGGSGRPHADYVLSLATVLDPDRRFASMPPDVAARLLATKLDLIASSPQAELMKGFWNRDHDPDRDHARVLVRLIEQQPTRDKNAIFDRAVADARADFGESSYLTGLSFLMTKTTEGVIATQWGTFLFSVVGILAMLTLALRGPVLATLAMVPTLLAVGIVLGLMGWLGIKLDMATALVASVALGLSVDDTFHCLLQFRRARRTMSFSESLESSYSVSGPGVLLSSSAVAIGFLALRLSEFTPFSNFGTMVGIATAGSTVGNLLLLPACLTLHHQWQVRIASRKALIPPVPGFSLAIPAEDLVEVEPAAEQGR